MALISDTQLESLIVDIEKENLQLEENIDKSGDIEIPDVEEELTEEEIRAIQANETDAEKKEDWAWRGMLFRNERRHLYSVVYKTSEEAVEISKALYKSRKEYNKSRKEQIVKCAFAQNDITLTDALSEDDKLLLFEGVSRRLNYSVKSISFSLTKQMTRILMPFVPSDLKRCFKKYPDCVIHHQGFMYICTKEYGQSRNFWIVPEIPGCFNPGTEMELLNTLPIHIRFRIDYNIGKFYNSKQKLADLQIKIASKVARHKNMTFYALLRDNPNWFECTYYEKTGKHLLEQNTTEQ